VLILPPATGVVFPLPPNTDAKTTRNSTGKARVKNCDWRLRAKARRSYTNRCKAILIIADPSGSRAR
jgi:hypothetical protein